MIEPTMFDEAKAHWRRIIADLEGSILALEENPLSVISQPDLLAEMQRARHLARNILRGITAVSDMIIEFTNGSREIATMDVPGNGYPRSVAGMAVEETRYVGKRFRSPRNPSTSRG